jgi:type IV pilus assembly protein PilC
MAEFICRLGTSSGEIVTRVVEAAAASEARIRLEGEGFRVFAVSSAEHGLSSVLSLGRGGKKNKVKPGDFLLFNQQLSALLRAGIPVLQAIGLLKNRSGSAALRIVLADIEEKIKSGVPLSEAFEAQGMFPRIYTASLLAGERSGALDDVLARYVHYLKRSVGVSRKLRGALAYPAFLLTAAMIMVVFLTVYVVPRMSDLFKGLSSKGLPTVTVIVVSISNGVAANFWWLLPLVLIIALATTFWLRSPGGKLILHSFLLRIPLVGTLIKQMATAQLTRSIATLLAGGITVPDSWDIASQAITNVELRRRSQAVLAMIREGRNVTESLGKANWLPELALDMIGIGEKSGSLREMLDEVANFYDAETEVRMEQLTTLLEPIILVFMAAIVITILLAIYLPIIQSISSGPFAGRGK